MVEGCNKTDRRAGYCVTHGADKKCIVAECSKTGRIDSMCTKHYFERNQPFPRAPATGVAGTAVGSSSAVGGNAVGSVEGYDFDDDDDDDDDDGDVESAVAGANARQKLVASSAQGGVARARTRDVDSSSSSSTKRLKQSDYRGSGGSATSLKNAVAAMDLSKNQQF